MANATSLRSEPLPGASEDEPLSPLERHAAFFDPENTGSVTYGQTKAGLRALGMPLHWQYVLPVIINGFLGYLTQGKPSFTIDVQKIAEGKHPYDTGIFDDAGELDEKAFEALLGVASGGKLTKAEMDTLIRDRGNRRPQMGKIAGSLGRWFSARETQLLFCLASDTTKNGEPAITPRTLKRFYDGTLLHTLARLRRAKLAAQK